MAAGTDVVDLEACKARGITVCNIPSAASETVAEHAVGLYFAVRRNTVRVHERTVEGREWAEKRSTIQFFDTGAGAPRTCKNEVMGIIGGGRLGAFPSIHPSLSKISKSRLIFGIPRVFFSDIVHWLRSCVNSKFQEIS